MRSIGVQAQATAAADDRRRREVRRFQEHVAGGVGHLGVLPAHDAGQGDRTVGVGDHQEAIVQRRGAAVEQLQRFASAALAHADRTGEQVAIEGVHRLAQLQHHVLGDVHQQRDRAHAAAAQALGQPGRRLRGGVDAFDDATAVARRIGAGVEPDFKRALMPCGNRRGIERHHLAAECGGHVEGDAAHAETVGPVGRELDLDARIGQAQEIGDRGAQWCIAWQFQQTRRIGVHAQLPGRTQHAVGVHAAQPGRLDRDPADVGPDHRQRRDQPRTRIGRAAHDLQVLAKSGIDLAHLQAVGLRMPGAVDDARHDHLVQTLAQRGDLFDLQADRGQRGREFIARGAGGDVAAQPVFREFHRWSS